MDVSLLTPHALLVALLGLVPIGALLERRRRARRARTALGLGEPDSSVDARIGAAFAALALLLGVAAAQPVIERSQPLSERTDAEIFFALDTSRSMLAGPAPQAATRFERARAAALAVRSQLPNVPAGVAQFTDWAVPHLFPTVDTSTFASVLERALYVDSLGSRSLEVLATDLDALGAFARDGYFSPGAARRVLVVLTDGESEPSGPGLAQLRTAGIGTVFVHVWSANESVWAPRGAEPEYRADPASVAHLEQAARVSSGSTVDVNDLDTVVREVWARLGHGPTRGRAQRRDLVALMPLFALAALVPLAGVLRYRNL